MQIMHMLKQEVADKMRELITPMQVNRIIDIGTGYGESANFFSELKPEATIYTVDSFGLYGDGRIYNEFNHDKVKAINENLSPNVVQILGNSQKIKWELPFEVLFIDADHTYEGCSNDFYNYFSYLTKDGIVIFDDYTQENNPANGVKKFVKEIIDTDNRLTIIYEGYYCAILEKRY